jgi:hypothetical protein
MDAMPGGGTSAPTTPLKVVVVVHGIGDQTRYETVQAIVRACFGAVRAPKAVALGDLHTRLSRGEPWAEGYPGLDGLAFAEAHWADVARARERYTMEGTGRWVGTVVERLRLQDQRYAPATPGLAPIPYELVRRQLLDAVRVLRLLTLLNRLLAKLELGSIPLDRVLTSFVGDVQLFAEFGVYRERMLERFDDVVEAVDERATRQGRPVEIHVVGHSQGSAIALLGILLARARGKRWVRRLASLSTLGSPIDKFVALWSPLWGELFRAAPSRPPAPGARWHNYVDLGDPVGETLELGGDLVGRVAPGLFAGDRATEHVFARYLVPGKAHVDYWDDQALWSHWLAHVVGWDPPAPAPVLRGPPPLSRPWPKVVAPAVTYLLPVAVLAAAGWAAGRGAAAMTRGDFEPRHALGIAALLVSATALGSVTRLARRWIWYVVTLAGMAAGARVFLWAFDPPGETGPFGAPWPAVWVAGAAAAGALLQNAADARFPRRRTFLLHVLLAGAVLAAALGRGWARPDPVGFLWFGLAFVLWAIGTVAWDFAVLWQSCVRGSRHVDFLRARWRANLADRGKRAEGGGEASTGGTRPRAPEQGPGGRKVSTPEQKLLDAIFGKTLEEGDPGGTEKEIREEEREEQSEQAGGPEVPA